MHLKHHKKRIKVNHNLQVLTMGKSELLYDPLRHMLYVDTGSECPTCQSLQQ